MDAHEPEPGPEPQRARSVRQQLGIFTVALIAPVLALSGFLFWQIATTERARLERDAFEAARAIASSIDRELTGLFSAIDVLTTSRNLQRGDLEAFHMQVSELARRQGLVSVLSDLSGQQLVNSRTRWGEALPRSNLPVDPAAIESGRPFATDLFRGAVSGEQLFSIATGISVEERPTYVLSFSLDLERLRRILREADLPEASTASIIDRRGAIMARSARHDEFVGREATQDLRDNTLGQQGTWWGTTVDGAPVFGAYVRSRLSGFRAAVGIRSADINAPLVRFLTLFSVLSALLLALSVALGMFFGQRITMPIKRLAESAAALGRGEAVQPLDSGLREADQVGAELVSASAQLRERETDLVEANEEIQRFAYIVSHDLRSPLVNIMGFTSELEALRADLFRRLEALTAEADEAEREGDQRLGQDFDEAIDFIKASIGKMDRLINAILRLSREGRREFSPERVDMDALIENIRASLAHQADEAEATISVSRLPTVRSDRLALEQVFSNLLDNALKYLRRGVPGRIEVHGRATSSNVIYEVRDNGRGVDAKDRERIFELFRRSGAQDRPGEGIGLAHVRQLVRRLGGSITLTSTPGQGSTFTVTLPRRWAGDTQRKAA